jgi:glycosyltransferase 2 family protein
MASQSLASESPISAETARRKPYLGFALRVALGLAAILFLMRRYNARPILNAMERERIGFFMAAVALYVAGQALSAWRWQLLARLGALSGPYIDYLRYYFIGVFTNLFVPGLVGGDAARSLYLGRRQRGLAAAVASVVADRGIGLVTLFWFAAISAVLFKAITMPPAVRRIVVILGLGTFTGWLLGPIFVRWIGLLPAKFRRMAGELSPYLECPRKMLPAIGLSLVLQTSLVVCQYLIGLGLGVTAPFAAFLVCVPIANVVASLPITFNGLGLRETAYLVLLSGAGIGHPDAVAMGLLWFAASMTGGLTGIIAFATTDPPSPLERSR